MRDRLLDILRGLTMIHIVCVIHVLWYFGLAREPIYSFLLFEMPAIFFIAGASQLIKGKSNNNKDNNSNNNKDNNSNDNGNNDNDINNNNNHNNNSHINYSQSFNNLLQETISFAINRARRILLPYWRFLIVLYLVLAIVTVLPIDIMSIDITTLTWQEIVKTILTGGCTNIPYYGYTWFISCYFIITISLPLQRRLINITGNTLYIIINTLAVFILSFVELPIGNIEIHNLPVYNTFFLMGYFYYRRLSLRQIIIATMIGITATAVLVSTNNFFSMQEHKFPADYVFLIWGTTAICIFSMLITLLRPYLTQGIRHIIYTISKPWNVYGYEIYLYQCIYFIIVTVIVLPHIEYVESTESLFMAFILLFLSTFLCAIVVPLWITMWKTLCKTRS